MNKAQRQRASANQSLYRATWTKAERAAYNWKQAERLRKRKLAMTQEELIEYRERRDESRKESRKRKAPSKGIKR